MPQTTMLANKFVLKKITEDIFYWENCFENSKEIVDLINDKEFNEVRVTSETGETSLLIKQRRLERNSKPRKKVLTEMIKCFDQYCNINNIDKSSYYFPANTMAFCYIAPNIGMSAHTDIMYPKDGVELIPSFTILAYLDSDYTGGEVFFENIDIRPSAGSILMFKNPIHGVRPMTQGQRNIVMQPLIDFNQYGESLLELDFTPFTETNF